MSMGEKIVSIPCGSFHYTFRNPSMGENREFLLHLLRFQDFDKHGNRGRVVFLALAYLADNVSEGRLVYRFVILSGLQISVVAAAIVVVVIAYATVLLKEVSYHDSNSLVQKNLNPAEA